MAQYLEKYEKVQWGKPEGLRVFYMALFSNDCIPVQKLSKNEKAKLESSYVKRDQTYEDKASTNTTEYHVNTICVVHGLLPADQNKKQKKIQLI